MTEIYGSEGYMKDMEVIERDYLCYMTYDAPVAVREATCREAKVRISFIVLREKKLKR